MTTSLPLSEAARLAPKIDLHCHLTGSISLETSLELVKRNAMHIDPETLREAYEMTGASYAQIEEKFFDCLDIVAGLLHTPDDLRFAVASIARDRSTDSNLRYLEMFVNPTALQRSGMTWVEVRDGLVAGAAEALTHKVIVRFIACFLREESTELAHQMIDQLIDAPSDEFIGVGLDGPENLPGSEHSRFADVFKKAGKAGYHRTSHLTSTAPETLLACLDLLGCERIDHGYPVADNPAMLQLAVDRDIPFTCCLGISSTMMGPTEPRYARAETHPTTHMLAAGLRVVLGTDDGAVSNTNIGKEYVLAAEWYSWDFDQLESACLASLDVAWLTEPEREVLRRDFASELVALRARVNA